jgi:glucokinase
MTALVGIDIGGTGTRFVVLDSNRNLVAKLTERTPVSGPVEKFIIENVEKISSNFSVQGIGIGASGPIDSSGRVQNIDTLPAFTGVPILGLLRERFRIPVTIENDAACAAIAEYELGAGKNYSSLVHVTLGTGIGVAVVNNGVVMRGGDGQHPEAGHISVPGSDNPCYCGRISCWEKSASRQALQEEASRLLGLAPNDRSSIEELSLCSKTGDESATAVFEEYGSKVADGLATLLSIHRPQAVILGGWVSSYHDFYADALRRALEPLGGWISCPVVLASKFNDFGGAVGAAIFAERESLRS